MLLYIKCEARPVAAGDVRIAAARGGRRIVVVVVFTPTNNSVAGVVGL